MISTFEDKSYSAYKHNININDLMKSLSAPLTYFNIDSFVFQRIFLNKGVHIAHLTVSNNLPWMKQHLLNCNFLGASFLEEIQKADNNVTKFFSWEADPNQPQRLPEFGIKSGFNIYEKKKDYLEVTSFCRNKYGNELMYTCINNLESIKQFITYFKTKASFIIDTSDSNRISYFNEIYEPIDSNEVFYLRKQIENFSDEIKLNKFYFDKNHHLSKREMECIALLSKGKSLKEAGSFLQISPRTVESYLKQIKEKTGCNTSQIINLFLRSEYKCFFNEDFS